jgi:hypothetical protein
MTGVFSRENAISIASRAVCMGFAFVSILAMGGD